MTILPSNTEFPNNVIELITLRVPAAIDADLQVWKRPLRPTDGPQAVAIFPSTKVPVLQSKEIRGVESTLKTYNFIVQSMVQDTDEANCISVHSILANRLWSLWLSDSPLHAGLTVLSVTANNRIERFQRRDITLQRYLSNEVQGTFVQTAWIECWFETETVETN